MSTFITTLTQITAHGLNYLLPQQGFQRQLAGLDNHKSHIHLAYNDGGVTDPQNGRESTSTMSKRLLHFLRQFINLREFRRLKGQRE